MPTSPPSEARHGHRTLRLAVDTTPLLGHRSGVGTMAAAVIERLAGYDDIELSGYMVSWRGRDRHDSVLPPGCRPVRVRWPARLSHRLWRRFDHPRLDGRYDLVHGTNYVVPPSSAANSLVTVHDLTAWRYPELVDRHSAAYPRLVARALERGAHVHCVTRFVADELIETLAVEPELVHVISNGFEPGSDGNGERARRRIGGPYVLVVGTIEPRKDHAGLVRAMADVWRHHPDVKLAVVGADGWGVDAFEQALDDVKAGDRVIRLGYETAEAKADLLAGAEVLAFPSVYEGFGLPILEAFDAGVPVVATQVGAIREVAADAALLVPPGHPGDLAAALVQVIGDRGLRSTLIERGRRRTGAFSWDRSVAELVDLYHRLTD